MTVTQVGTVLPDEEAAPREEAALCEEAEEEAEHVIPLPHAAVAVPAVRRRVRAALTGWHLCADVVDDVLLLASELLTNAVVHALPPATLRLSRLLGHGRSTVLRVEVTDMGPAPAAGRPASESAPDEHGRGIDIVMALSDRCGVREHFGGTSRWAEVVVS
ncbi:MULTISPECIES: ATP-binding protein [unclassified Streptomyces]|uniref:ATP-binding protein n=1 Tax=unclassified Streptomyces TaxID=2593676 RepID=UPI001F0414F6|nr:MULTISPECIES: ATP-binding protein [unclassified Streptomyces]MCH0564808.1 ATP-binding protein [Streptomyces sp. MUM 2J]MCH0569910.1 ATP-binding protein [Streptomyces sp. MUM 136J]